MAGKGSAAKQALLSISAGLSPRSIATAIAIAACAWLAGVMWAEELSDRWFALIVCVAGSASIIAVVLHLLPSLFRAWAQGYRAGIIDSANGRVAAPHSSERP
jgi:hypothetical protein